MEDESGRSGEENGYDGKKIKEIERATINRSKEKDKERVAINLVTERIGGTETGKRQQEEEAEREEAKKEIKKFKRIMENRKRRERKRT